MASAISGHSFRRDMINGRWLNVMLRTKVSEGFGPLIHLRAAHSTPSEKDSFNYNPVWMYRVSRAP